MVWCRVTFADPRLRKAKIHHATSSDVELMALSRDFGAIHQLAGDSPPTPDLASQDLRLEGDCQKIEDAASNLASETGR